MQDGKVLALHLLTLKPLRYWTLGTAGPGGTQGKQISAVISFESPVLLPRKSRICAKNVCRFSRALRASAMGGGGGGDEEEEIVFVIA
jgi:hypothetical protein